MALTTFGRELYEQGLREEGEARGEARGIVETCQEFGKSQLDNIGSKNV